MGIGWVGQKGAQGPMGPAGPAGDNHEATGVSIAIAGAPGRLGQKVCEWSCHPT